MLQATDKATKRRTAENSFESLFEMISVLNRKSPKAATNPTSANITANSPNSDGRSSLTSIKFDRKDSLVRKDERDYKKGSHDRILSTTQWKPKRNIIKTTGDILSYWRDNKNHD